MSLVQEILYTISNYPGGYKLIYNVLYDNKPPNKDRKKGCENTLRATLSRMKSGGLLKNKDGEWSITPEGKEFLSHKKSQIKRYFPQNHENKKEDKKMIVIFDIPEKERRYRDLFRVELVSLGFDQVQKSVWFGPSLPKSFVEYLDEIDILKYIRFFRATERDLI